MSIKIGNSKTAYSHFGWRKCREIDFSLGHKTESSDLIISLYEQYTD